MIFTMHYEFDATPSTAYDALADLERHHEWSGIHHSWTVPPPAYADLQVGHRAHHMIEIFGIPAELRWTVTEHDRPKVFELTGTGRMGAHMRLRATFEPRPKGCELMIETEIDGGPLSGLGGQSMSRIIRAHQHESVEQLRAMIEQDAKAAQVK